MFYEKKREQLITYVFRDMRTLMRNAKPAKPIPTPVPATPAPA